MGEWEYLFVSLRQCKAGGPPYIDTVNDEELPNRYKLAHEYFNEMGKERWEAVGPFDLAPEHPYPTIVLKRQVEGEETAPQRHAASIGTAPSLFGDLNRLM